MYNLRDIEIERRERNRDLMRQAARERLVDEALAGRKDRAGRRRALARLGERLMAGGAAVASLFVTLPGQPA